MKKDLGRILKGKVITAEFLNNIVKEVERLGNFTVSPPLSMTNDAGGVSLRVKSTVKYQSHQAKTLQAMEPGDTADVELYIEGGATGDNVEATVCPTISEIIPIDTWIRLNRSPTEDGKGRWEIVGFFYECEEE